jgi:hypothetical protein
VETHRHAERCVPVLCVRQPPQTNTVVVRFQAGRRAVVVDAATHHGYRLVTCTRMFDAVHMVGCGAAVCEPTVALTTLIAAGQRPLALLAGALVWGAESSAHRLFDVVLSRCDRDHTQGSAGRTDCTVSLHSVPSWPATIGSRTASVSLPVYRRRPRRTDESLGVSTRQCATIHALTARGYR